MQETYRDMFAVLIAVLCLMSVSQSAPLACEKLVRTFDQLDAPTLVGRWSLVASSQKNAAAAEAMKRRDSLTIDFYNSSYTQASRLGDQCSYRAHNLSMEGHIFTLTRHAFNFTVTFMHTSCPDCALLTMDVESPTSKSMDFYLLSKRRALEEKEMEEFRQQVECLNMPPAVVMDPTKELCPEETGSDPSAQAEEQTEGQKD